MKKTLIALTALCGVIHAQTQKFDATEAAIYSPANNDSSASVEVSADGLTVKVINNCWRSFPLQYNVTANTVISFELRAEEAAEHFGVVIDDANGSNPTRRLPIKLGGTQGGGIYWHDPFNGNYYTLGSGWVRYIIPLGTHYPVFTADRVGFIRDADAGAIEIGTAEFRNFRIYESAADLSASDLQVHQDLTVDGDVTLFGDLVLERVQGDIPMGIYGQQ